MTVLRCTAKLLKRLKQAPRQPEPEPQANPLGEWLADLDHWNRKPFVVMINSTTGALLVLNGNAAGLRVLHERAHVQIASLFAYFGLAGPAVEAEVNGFAAGFTFANSRDRSLQASLNGRKDEAWIGFEHRSESLADAACFGWEHGWFTHPSLGRGARAGAGAGHHHRTLDLLRQRLCPSATIHPFPVRGAQ